MLFIFKPEQTYVFTIIRAVKRATYSHNKVCTEKVNHENVLGNMTNE